MMTDLLSLYRDVLITQLQGSVDLVNIGQQQFIDRLATRSAPEATITMMDAIGTARERLAGNVAPLLVVEAMLLALRPRRAA